MALNCQPCIDYAASLGANLIGAAASVGIEHGLSTGAAVRMYLQAHHAQEGHVDQPSIAGTPEEIVARRRARRARPRVLFSRSNQCVRKAKYASPERARLEAKKTGQPLVHAYHCRYCGGWHVGKAA